MLLPDFTRMGPSARRSMPRGFSLKPKHDGMAFSVASRAFRTQARGYGSMPPHAE
ncbi:hypothetical protein [Desulfovibrio intestinalis]|uniref:Uncharacterized protein n=1 Tax=Desulfovibrio intestinalis TaxID=58621 RepID=A0A7W8C457_9BACT|nr:hypothetical protein [Desulfovibrio intestinalis]MBB5144448.1 hypothetical protein [Desulfovibrio intestinalis]